jgi:hypothetical protein
VNKYNTCLIVGTRPNFVKAAPLLKQLEDSGKRVLFIHTGQHFDEQMSNFIFKDLQMRSPDINLNTKPNTEPNQVGFIVSALDGIFQNLMNESSIYFHARNYETVGLPLYEASDSGLIIVAPNLPYMQYFDSNNVFTYEHGNLEDAKKKLLEALSNTNNSLTTYSYDENWIEVLKNF